MASMIISTVGLFVPERVMMVFLLVACIGFFGIYIPLEEKKKRGGKKRPAPKPRKESNCAIKPDPAGQKGPEQLKALKEAGVISEEEYQKKLAHRK